MFSRMELDELMTAEVPVAVSIYLPTHLKGRDVRQDPIRLKNLIDRAAGELPAFGLRKPEIEALLAPAEDLIPVEEFWRHQDHGLGLFLAPGFCRVHKLPVDVEEAVHAGHRFHLKPLLPVLASDGRFFVLTLTEKRVRLFLGSKYRIAELDVPELPRASEENAAATETDDQRAGEPPGETGKTQPVDSLRRIETVVREFLAGDRAPLVLIAEPENDGYFRSISKLDNLVETAVHHNPEAFSADALHEMAYAIVRPLFDEATRQTLDRFRMLKGNFDPKGATAPSEVVKGARDSRVDTLLLVEGAALWGGVNGEGEITAVHDAPETGDEDLAEVAAYFTLRNGGHVHHVGPEELPDGTVMAAVFRW
jgi:hypothetical protein